MAGAMRGSPGALTRLHTPTYWDWQAANLDVWLRWIQATRELGDALITADYDTVRAAFKGADDALYLLGGAIENLRPNDTVDSTITNTENRTNGGHHD
jgi:hypothetical protein